MESEQPTTHPPGARVLVSVGRAKKAGTVEAIHADGRVEVLLDSGCTVVRMPLLVEPAPGLAPPPTRPAFRPGDRVLVGIGASARPGVVQEIRRDRRVAVLLDPQPVVRAPQFVTAIAASEEK